MFEYNEVITKVQPDWLDFFQENKKEFEDILNQVNEYIINGDQVFPNPKDLLRTLFYFPPQETKLIILGQDPYIGSEIHDNVKIPQAHGLSFSVPKKHKKIPPSLKNIYKELKNSYPEFIIPKDGCLKKWVKQEKILLLNSALTVVEGKSNSHQILWNNFTNKLIKYISSKNPNTIFLLMGKFAIGKSDLIDTTKHKIFTTVHPSPLSASKGFFGCDVFKQINNYLESNNIILIKYF